MTIYQNLAVSLLLVTGLRSPAVCAAAIDPAKVVIIKADDYRGSTQGWTNFIQASRELGVKVSLGVIVNGIAGDAAAASAMQAQEAQGDVEFWNHGWDHLQFQNASEQGGTGIPDSAAFKSAYPNGPVGPVSLQLHPNSSPFNAARTLEYKEIVNYLLAKGHTFLLPSEYIALLDGPPPGFQPPVAAPGTASTSANQPATTPDSAPPLTLTAENDTISLAFVATKASGPGYSGLTRRFTLQSAEDLSAIDPWVALPGYPGIPGDDQSVTLTLPASPPRRFYRLLAWLH